MIKVYFSLTDNFIHIMKQSGLNIYARILKKVSLELEMKIDIILINLIMEEEDLMKVSKG